MSDEKKSVGWWIGWVGVSTLIAGGAGTAIVKGVQSGSSGATAAGGGALVALAYILWNRFK